jgi:N-acetylglutamate synthase-like GNAT family acetyltransferase
MALLSGIGLEGKIDSVPSAGLVVRIIDSEEDLEEVLALRYKTYFDAGFYKSGGLKAADGREIPDRYEVNATNIVLERDSKIKGAIRIIHDSKIGVPAGKLFDVAKLRSAGRIIAEPSRFAVDPNAQGSHLSDILLQAMRQYALETGITDYVFSARPHQQEYYERFGAVAVTGILYHDDAKVPAIGFHWNIAATNKSFAERWDSTPLPRLTMVQAYA